MVPFSQAWQLRWENAYLLPGIFKNTHTYPAYVGGRFFTNSCKGSGFPQRRNSQRLFVDSHKKENGGQWLAWRLMLLYH